MLQVLRESPQGVARPRAWRVREGPVGVPGCPLLIEVLGVGCAMPTTAAWFCTVLNEHVNAILSSVQFPLKSLTNPAPVKKTRYISNLPSSILFYFISFRFSHSFLFCFWSSVPVCCVGLLPLTTLGLQFSPFARFFFFGWDRRAVACFLVLAKKSEEKMYGSLEFP